MANARIGALRVDLGLNSAAFERGLGIAERRLNRFAGQMNRVGERMRSIGARMTLGITAPLGAIGVAAVRAASDFEELRAAHGETFGAMAAEMERWAEVTGNRMGRATQEIMRGAQMFGLYFNQAARTREEAARMSRTFTVLSQDLASFHNTSVEDALTALRSGLAGETEPLRRYGVLLDGAAVSAQALEMGLVPVNGRLTDQQKIMARYAIIMEQTANAQGDVIRTSDSHANQLRRANAAWEELKVTLGEKLLPVITPLVERLGTLVDRFANLPSGVQTAIVAIAALAALVGPLAFGFGAIVSAVSAVIPLLGSAGVGAALAGLAPLIAPIAAAVGGLAAAWLLLGEDVGPVLATLRDRFQEVFGPRIREALSAIAGKLQELWDGPLGEGLRTVIDWLGQLAAIVTRVFGELFITALSVTVEAVRGGIEFISNILGGLIALLSGDFAGAWDYAKRLVTDAIGAIGRIVEAVFPGLIDWVARLVNGVRDWLQNRLGAVFEWLRSQLTAVGDWFENLYDRVVGNSYVPDMVDEIGQHVRRLQTTMVDPIDRATTSAAQSFQTMAQSVSGSIEGLINSVRSGDWGGIVGGALDLLGAGLQIFGGGRAGASGGLLPSVPGGNFFLGGGNVPAFASGGSFRIGGLGGIDRNLLSMNGNPIARVSRGEIMDIRKGAANDTGRIVVELSPDLVAKVLSESAANSVQIVRAARPGIVNEAAATTRSSLMRRRL